MGDEDGKSTRSRFLSKLQRSKSTKDDTTDKGQTYEVHDDVADFLKPSTERAALLRPRIDVGVAQRWPEAHKVAGQNVPPESQRQHDVNHRRKRRRREGLAVTFTPNPPEIIGEGGDESSYPTIEISRMKSRTTQPAMRHMYRRSLDVLSRPAQAQVMIPDQKPGPLRRAHTAHQEQLWPSEKRYEQTRSPPLADATVAGVPRSTNSPFSQQGIKRSQMAEREGMALKRAGSEPYLNDIDDHGNDNEHDDEPIAHTSSGAETQNFLMPAKSTRLAQTAQLPDSQQHLPPRNFPPQYRKASAVQPIPSDLAHKPTRSPFDDPKYQQRQIDGSAPAPRPAYPGQAQYVDGTRERSGSANSTPTVAASSADKLYSPDTSTKQSEHNGNVAASSADKLYSPYTSTKQPEHIGDAATKNESAFSEFATRVAHMKGVFELTAEKERPGNQCTFTTWFRTACWWYSKGRASLEGEMKQRSRSRQPVEREILLQGHVDLAKAWWILTSRLESSHDADSQSRRGYGELRSQLQTLCILLSQSSILPPSASLIQGQDTRIWLSEASSTASPYLSQSASMSILDVSPLGDTASQFCYSRLSVDVVLDSQDKIGPTSLSCMLTITRGANDYDTGFVLASHIDLINVRVGEEGKGLSWRSVSWNQSMSALSIHLPDKTMLHLRLQAHDYRFLGSMIEYTRKIVASIQSGKTENRVFDTQLSRLQYTTTAVSPFPREDIGQCRMLLFEARDIDHHQSIQHRIVLATNPSTKILSHVTHRLGSSSIITGAEPLDKQAVSTTLSFDDGRQHARATLDFKDHAEMLAFHKLIHKADSTINASSPPSISPPQQLQSQKLIMTPTVKYIATEAASIAGTIPILDYQIQPVSDVLQDGQLTGNITSSIQWHNVQVLKTNAENDDHTIVPSSISISICHAYGTLTDPLPIIKGELAIRLTGSADTPSVRILRERQLEFDGVVDKQRCSPVVSITADRVVQLARQHPTIRTIVFSTPIALHSFQAAITGYNVQYDGHASTFAISRRMMVVPIHHKWTANDVRLQVVSNNEKTVVKILAFMDNFDHADAMCFQVKSTDVFERIKGDSKGKKWAVKLVDAKFSLPIKIGSHDGDEARLRRQYINLDGLDYAEEHDDITIGFDTEEYRDVFAQALPAATTVARGLILRRRI